MTNRSLPRALARTRLLAELDLALRRARAEADALAVDPDRMAEVGLLIAQLDRIASEVEHMRLAKAGGGIAAGPRPDPATRPEHWNRPPSERKVD